LPKPAPPRQSNPLTRRYDVKFITTLGFGLVIGILLIAILGSHHTTGSHNKALADLVHIADIKTVKAYTMREAIRERIESLKAMAEMEDVFDRDEEKMRFFGLAAKYVRARIALVEKLHTESEHAIFQALDEAAKTVGPPNTRALGALFDPAATDAEVDRAVQGAIDSHRLLLSRLDEMVQTIHRSTQQRIRAAANDFNRAFWMATVLGVVAFIIALFTAAFVILNAGARSRQLTHQAAHDVLTGLLNRQAFEAALRLTLEESAFAPENHALLLLDLDRFKVVNDSCGHPAGDALLRALSAHLAGRLRQSDVFARLGGDEFGVLLRYTEPADAERVAEKLRAAIEAFSFSWQGQTFRIGASIGMVAFGHQPIALEELLSAVDACCYSAKEEGRNRVHHRPIDDAAIQRRNGEMRWIHRINEAIQHDRFVLYGQMIKPLRPALDDGRMVLEVLLRMADDEGLGIIPPGQFLPVAERYGIVPDIDRWVVANAIGWLASLGPQATDVRININISGPAASDPKFHEHVRTCIDAHLVPPESLCFEITESDAIRSLANAAALIDGLGDLGCRFALDDFGSGMSSFNQLRHLKIDYLKIDGSFVHNIDRDDINRAMVESINTIGKKLGKHTIAEFVENDRVKQILTDIDVDFAQGFGLHKPEPLSQLRAQFDSARRDDDTGRQSVA
jgi:diguanylate cyclase (GGDEF)-like protein